MISKTQRMDLVLMTYNAAKDLTLEELADVTEQTEICIGVMKAIFQEKNGGYDREGYDSAGYDRSGRDSAGYDRAVYECDDY
jgi:hypothetical protein